MADGWHNYPAEKHHGKEARNLQLLIPDMQMDDYVLQSIKGRQH